VLTASFQTSLQPLNDGRGTIQVHDLAEFLVQEAQPAFIAHVRNKRHKLDTLPPPSTARRASVEAARHAPRPLSDVREQELDTAVALGLVAPSPLSSRPIHAEETVTNIDENALDLFLFLQNEGVHVAPGQDTPNCAPRLRRSSSRATTSDAAPAETIGIVGPAYREEAASGQA
jgi:hypothetical protein